MDLKCGSCNSWENIVLVCQLYVPIDDIDRSLYVFACNRRRCSLTSKGWTVIRNQNLTLVGGSKSGNLATPKKVEETVPENPSVWDFSSGPISDDGQSEEVDLLNLLSKRANNLKVPTSSSKNNAKSKSNDSPKKDTKSTGLSTGSKKIKTPVETESVVSPSPTSSLITIVSLPEIRIIEIDEPLPPDFKTGTVGGEEDSDDDEILPFDQQVDNKHIQDLLSSYMRDEDDTEALHALQQLHLNASSSSVPVSSEKLETHGNDGVVTDEEVSFPVRQQEVRKNKTKSAVGKPVAKEDDFDLETRGNDKKTRTELLFQRRVSLEPNQVIRYAYSGSPLWITYPSPVFTVDSSNPVQACECCGSTRVYECQLMPALLSYILHERPSLPDEIVQPAKVSEVEVVAKPANLTEELQKRLGDELDFGVVVIYSCPNSCFLSEHSSFRFLSEFVVVQPPPDI
jgi:hypothetical protein